MRYTSNDTKLNAFLERPQIGIAARSGGQTQPAHLRVIREGATQGIAQLIAKGSNAWQLRDIGFRGQLFGRQRALAGTPALAIYK